MPERFPDIGGSSSRPGRRGCRSPSRVWIRVHAALLRGAAPHTAAQRVRPRVLLRHRAVREPRAAERHSRNVRHDRWGPDAASHLTIRTRTSTSLRRSRTNPGSARRRSERSWAAVPSRSSASRLTRDAAPMNPSAGPAAAPLHWWTARDLAAAIAAVSSGARSGVVAPRPDRGRQSPDNAIVSLRRSGAGGGRGRGPPRRRAGSRWDRCTACRSPSRTSRTPRGFAPPMARRPRPARPGADSLLVARLARPGRSWWARPTRLSSGSARPSSTRCSAPRATRGPWTARPAAAAAAPGRPSPRGWSPSPTALTTAAAFATQLGSTTSSAPADAGVGPRQRRRDIWDTASVVGPMARTVGDLALMLTAISAPDPGSPLSHGDPTLFARGARPRLVGLRVAWCPDVGGLPIGPRSWPCSTPRGRLEALGCHVQDVALDLSHADDAFETLPRR